MKRILLINFLAISGVIGLGFLLYYPATFPEVETPDFEQAISLAEEALRQRGVAPDHLEIIDASWTFKIDLFDQNARSRFSLRFEDPGSREEIEGRQPGLFATTAYSVTVDPVAGISANGVRERREYRIQENERIRSAGTSSQRLRGIAIAPAAGPLCEPDASEIEAAAIGLLHRFRPFTRRADFTLVEIEYTHRDAWRSPAPREKGTFIACLAHNLTGPFVEDGTDEEEAGQSMVTTSFRSSGLYRLTALPDRRINSNSIHRTIFSPSQIQTTN